MTFIEFVQRLGTVKLTRAQRVLCAVCFDGVQPRDLKGVDRELAASMFGRDVETIAADLRSVVAWVKGSRIGGSLMAALRALHLAVTAPLASLAAGESAFVVLVGPDTRIPRQVLGYIEGALRSHPELERMIATSAIESLTIRRDDGRNVVLEILPASKGGAALRGRSMICAVMTEAAFFRGTDSAVNDQEIYRALLPRVLPGGQLILESTPWSEQGLLWELHRDNWGSPDTCLVATCPTLLLRDDAETRALVAKERRRDPESSAREHDAKFLNAGSGLFFEPQTIRASVDGGATERIQCPSGWEPYVGMDLGLSSDASAICAVHRSVSEPHVVHVAEWLELRPRRGQPLDLAAVMAEFTAFATRHGARVVMCDHHLRPTAQTMTQLNLIESPGGQQGKQLVHLSVRDSMRAGLVKMPASASGLREQLSQITAAPLTGGGLAIRQPRRGGSHGDVGSAFMLAAFSAGRGHSFAIDWEFVDALRAEAPRPLEIPGVSSAVNGPTGWQSAGPSPSSFSGGGFGGGRCL